MEVLDWDQLKRHDAYRQLQMEQVIRAGEKEIVTTRCPIRINGERLVSSKPAPKVGEHTAIVMKELASRS
jgi:crotonobetainyl-CoA:carnitine CoA-transferase CaiB-like acyl-CoA transferase